MTRKIFLYAFALGGLVLVVSTLILFGLQYRQTMDEAYAALREETSYAVIGLEEGGGAFLKKLDTINRITWINGDGQVLFDSEFPVLKTPQGDVQEGRQSL